MIVRPSKLEIDFLKSDLVRSPGLHASDIYGDLFKKLEPKRYDIRDKETGEPEEMNGVLMALGTAWEKHFERLLEWNGIAAERPTEFMDEETGIAYSPDLLFFIDEPRLGEIKLTSMSLDGTPTEEANCFPPKFNKYLAQLKFYARFLNMPLLWLGVVSIREPWKPQFAMWDIECTTQEIEENYRMLMNHARHTGMLKGHKK